MTLVYFLKNKSSKNAIKHQTFECNKSALIAKIYPHS